jgi:hypothetical protein
MALSHPVLSLGGSKIAVDVPHLAFVTAIVAWCVWFCRDTWLAQADVENIITIVPASVAAGILYVFVAAGCFRAVGHLTDHTIAPAR